MTETITDAELVARAGRALYGDAWQGPMAELLGVNPRTVQRIAKAAAAGEDYPAARALADVARAVLAGEHPARLMVEPSSEPTDAELVVRAGRALYGDAWQSPLAVRLGANLRTISRIAEAAAKGEDYRTASALFAPLRQLLRERARECTMAEGALRRRMR